MANRLAKAAQRELRDRPTSRKIMRLRDLTQFVRPYPGLVWGTLAALLVAVTGELSAGLAVQSAIDAVETENKELLNRQFLLLYGVVALFTVGGLFRYYLMHRLSERIIADMREKVYGHIVTLSPSFFEGARSGEILSRLTADTSVIQATLSAVSAVALRSIMILIGGSALLIYTSPKLSALVLLAVVAGGIPIALYGVVVRRLSRESRDRVADVSALAGESLGAIETVQACTQENAERRAYNNATEQAYAAAMRNIRAWSVFMGVAMVLVLGMIVGVLWIGAQDLMAGRMTNGQVTAFVFYALLVANAFSSLTQVWGHIQQAAGATERLMELLATKAEIASPADPVALPEPGRGAVTLDHVTFRYPSRPENPALRDFSLDVAPGETVALVGPSGSGKSTVFKLLLRFFDPQQGSVRLDGIDLRQLDLEQLRRQISIVPQSPVIFSTSARENIRYGRTDATDAEVEAAAEAAAAWDFIRDLPQGFDTPLGEHGSRLSGGQKQRIAIARAILRDSTVLLFDEATSALDSESERLVHEAIDRLSTDRTTIVIAHRLATVLNADRIIVLDEGRVVATGTHDELLRQDGLYTRLARLQFSHGEALQAALAPAATM